MSRTDSKKVKAIRCTELDVAPMIDAASLVVDDLAAGCGAAFSVAKLTIIETWLAAHFVGVMDPTLVSEKFENAENKFMVGATNLSGILSDKYGQTANMLSGGCLVQLDKMKATAEFIQ